MYLKKAIKSFFKKGEKKTVSIPEAKPEQSIMEKIRMNKRNELISLRESRLDSIREFNEEYKRRTGDVWIREEVAMLEYDKQRRKDWEAVGMTPPSFQHKK